jgi:hypothetical protein
LPVSTTDTTPEADTPIPEGSSNCPSPCPAVPNSSIGSAVEENSSTRWFVRSVTKMSPAESTAAPKGSSNSPSPVVDVQLQDTSLGLEGELAWKTVTRPTYLYVNASDTSTTVEWGGINGPELPQGLVALPAAIGSSKKMRLRFSEIDFHEGGHLDVVNTSVRRPFVAFVPIN